MIQLLAAILGLTLIVAAALIYGSRHWESETRAMHVRLEAARLPAGRKTHDPDELIGLPAAVQKYFRTVLKDGQPIVAAAQVEHSGTFNMSAAGEKWKPFISVQRVVVQRPGFDWEARIEMMPGLTGWVHDAYIAGEGILHATLFGLISLVNLRGTPDLARGEFMRFLAEAAWYPTALLPSQGVQWTAIDNSSAQATLKDGTTTVTLLFRFDHDGLIASVRAESRGRMVKGVAIPTSWEGHWSDYRWRDGMRIPIEGEVAWVLPEGPKPYWRGRIAKLSYEFGS